MRLKQNCIAYDVTPDDQIFLVIGWLRDIYFVIKVVWFIRYRDTFLPGYNCKITNLF